MSGSAGLDACTAVKTLRKFPSETAYVLGDQKRLIQVVVNLLNNATKYTPEGGA